MAEKIQSTDYFLVAKGGLGGVADTWFSINGSVTITREGEVATNIEANNSLTFAGFGQLKEPLTGDYKRYIHVEETPQPIQETHINHNLDDLVEVADYVKEHRDTYKEKYKSMIVNSWQRGSVRLEFPSHALSYHKRKDEGTILYCTVSLYDEWGKLLIQSSGEGCLEGTPIWGNNHGAYYMIPDGHYKVVITNDGNNGLGSESWLNAECFRQDQDSPSAYYDFGGVKRLEKGQSATFEFNTHGVKKDRNGMIKINNVSRGNK